MIEDAVFTQVTSQSAVTDLIADRFYPQMLPEAPTLPAATYRFISEQKFPAMGSDGPLTGRRIQIDCWAKTPTDARSLAAAITAALERFSGTVSYASGSTIIQDIYREGVQDLYDFEARLFQRAVDFMVYYEE